MVAEDNALLMDALGQAGHQVVNDLRPWVDDLERTASSLADRAQRGRVSQIRDTLNQLPMWFGIGMEGPHVEQIRTLAQQIVDDTSWSDRPDMQKLARAARHVLTDTSPERLDRLAADIERKLGL